MKRKKRLLTQSMDSFQLNRNKNRPPHNFRNLLTFGDLNTKSQPHPHFTKPVVTMYKSIRIQDHQFCQFQTSPMVPGLHTKHNYAVPQKPSKTSDVRHTSFFVSSRRRVEDGRGRIRQERYNGSRVSTDTRRDKLIHTAQTTRRSRRRRKRQKCGCRKREKQKKETKVRGLFSQLAR